MLSKNKIKFIVSLQKKKVRDELRLFTVEGDKIVREFLNAGMPVQALYATDIFFGMLPDKFKGIISDINIVNPDELKKISNFITPHNVLAVVSMPPQETGFDNVLASI